MHKNFHNLILGVSVLPALLVMPAFAASYTWNHPDNIESYTAVDGDINHSISGVAADVFTGTAMRNTVNGDVNLILDGVTQSEYNGEYYGVWGNAFLSSAALLNLDGASAADSEQKLLPQYVDGDVSVIVKNNSVIGRNVIGNQFYTQIGTNEITTDIGLSGKTKVTISDSSVGKSVRGANIGDASANLTDTTLPVKVNNIEINIDNSFVKEEVISTGSYVSAGDVKINVTGDSVIGYAAKDSDVASTALDDGGWIIAGAQRNNSHVGDTQINFNTKGIIKVAGDVNVGSRERSTYNTDEDSVRGNATLNMFGGGNIKVGKDLRAYHVAGDTTLNLKNITANVVGTVKEFETINIDALSELHAGTLTMTSDDVLNIAITDADTYGKLFVNTLDVNGAKLNMTFKGEGTYNLISADTVTGDFFTFAENKVYDVTNNSGTFRVKAKSAEDIADDTGISAAAAATVSSVAKSESKQLQELSVKLQEKLASGDTTSVEHATKAIHPETESVVQSVSSSVQNTVVNAAAARMAMPSIGRSAGDVNLTSGGVWVQGLFNKSKQANAFNGYTRGIAAGLDGTFNKVWTIGAAYSFAHSDVTGSARDTEIDSNTVFLYGQYKPSEWYLNAIANYTWSDYSENGSVIDDALVFADYDVQSFGGHIATGYNFDNGITPELGLRYMHINADDYTNSYGIKTSMKDTDFLTGMAGAKYVFDIISGKHAKFTPELKAGVKYDLLSDKSVATIAMPGVDAYTIDGNRLNRLGGEFGIGLGMTYDNLQLSVNYDIDVRKDYTSQTGMLKFRYNF